MALVPTHVCWQRRMMFGMFVVSTAVVLLSLGALVFAVANG
ncbi:hypothetical protein [Streptomyces sp. NPDC050704]